MSKLNLFFLLFFLFLKCSPITDFYYKNSWVVWNVGQGQWVTHFINNECYHYDIGGETNSYQRIQKKLKELCYNKKNRIFLSHWDQDHFLNLFLFARNFPYVCWQSKPTINHKVKKSRKQIQAEQLPLPNCNSLIQTKLWTPPSAKFKNDYSVIAYDETVLIPGDSPIKLEKTWSNEFYEISETQSIILGHHGSRTSTGHKLLNKLVKLKQAIASARWEKYHHPHPDVLRRLKNKKTPVLKTEDWGNIWFETKSISKN